LSCFAEGTELRGSFCELRSGKLAYRLTEEIAAESEKAAGDEKGDLHGAEQAWVGWGGRSRLEAARGAADAKAG
jgi:hypothetical protein